MSDEAARLSPARGSFLPDDIITGNILPRLPVKSLLRFRSVCKHWKSLISNNPDFTNLHFHYHLQRSECYLLYDMKKASSRLLLLNLGDKPDEIEAFSEDDVMLRPNLMGSSHGLACFSISESYKGKGYGYSYVVSNPVIGARCVVEAPPCCRGFRVLCQGFGYSPSCNDYKIVALYGPNCRPRLNDGVVLPLVSHAYVFTFNNNTWSRVDLDYFPPGYAQMSLSEFPAIGNGESKKAPVQVGETLYWGLHGWSSIYFDPTLLGFDLANHSIRVVPLPDPLQDQRSSRELGMIDSFFISEIRGSLCAIWRLSSSPMLEVWMLEQFGDGDVELWKMFLTVEDVNAYWYRTLLDVKDDSGRLVLFHDDCFKLITPGCGEQQGLAASISTYSYQHRLQLTCAVGYIESLIWPFTHTRRSRTTRGQKRKQTTSTHCCC